MPSPFKSLDRLLRGDVLEGDSLAENGVDVPPVTMGLMAIFLGMIDGGCMGSFAVLRSGSGSTMQVWASALKTPLLFVATLAVTFPSHYVFSALLGSRVSCGALIKLIIAAGGITLAVLASLGPIVAFFSVSSSSYSFLLVLNVVVCAVGGFIGLGFMRKALWRLSMINAYTAVEIKMSGDETKSDVAIPLLSLADQAEIDESKTSDSIRRQRVARAVKLTPSDSPTSTLFYIWMVVFGFVGAQMSWLLRPFIGSPGREFPWFRNRGSNFFEAV